MPLLHQYFSYDELRSLKEEVIQQHEVGKEVQSLLELEKWREDTLTKESSRYSAFIYTSESMGVLNTSGSDNNLYASVVERAKALCFWAVQLFVHSFVLVIPIIQ